MNDFNLEDEELKHLFQSSLPDQLPADFTDQVMQAIATEGQRVNRFAPDAPKKSVAYGVFALLALLAGVSLLPLPFANAWPVISLRGKAMIGYAFDFLDHSVFTIASIFICGAVWALVYVHKKIVSSFARSAE